MLKTLWKTALMGGAAIALTGGAHAATFAFTTTFTELNDSGGSGDAFLTFDDEANTLRVQINAEGLDEGLHVMHIHGRFDGGADGMPIDSVTPVPLDEFDSNGDGTLTVAEGAAGYGPIVLPLPISGGADSSDFPIGTSIDYDRTFDFDAADADTLFATVGESSDRYELTDLLPLMFREIVIHGVLEEDGYVASRPALAGEIDAVPVPGAVVLFGSALAAFGIRRRRQAA